MTTTVTGPSTVQPAKATTRWSRRFTWLTVLVLVVAVAIGFGAGFLTSHLTQDEPTGLADDATVSLIQDNMAAFNAGDAKAFAATTTTDVVFTALGSDGTLVGEATGPSSIMNSVGQTSGLKATSEFVQQGDLVSSTYSESATTGVQIYHVVNGKIAQVWIIMN